jgi:hypothetical protein
VIRNEFKIARRASEAKDFMVWTRKTIDKGEESFSLGLSIRDRIGMIYNTITEELNQERRSVHLNQELP